MPLSAEERQRRIRLGQIFKEYVEDDRTKTVFQAAIQDLFHRWSNTDNTEEARKLFLESRGLHAVRNRIFQIIEQGKAAGDEVDREEQEDDIGFASTPITAQNAKKRGKRRT